MADAIKSTLPPRTKKMVRQMQKAIRAWAELDKARADFQQAWDACGICNRERAFKELGITPTEETLRGDAFDAFQNFSC